MGSTADRIGSRGEPGHDADSSRRRSGSSQDALERKPFVVIPRINQKVVVGTVFVSAMFMNIIDITIVNVALPTIGRDFHIAPTAVDGIVIAYLVSLAVFIPASGWLGDRFGGKRVLLVAIVVFTARVRAVWARSEHDAARRVPHSPRCRWRDDGAGRHGDAVPGFPTVRARARRQHLDRTHHLGSRPRPGARVVSS